MVQLAIGGVLNELEGNIGPITDPGKPQCPNVDGKTCLGTLPFEVGNNELIATVGVVEVVERAGILDR